jgi:hypothetical protein
VTLTVPEMAAPLAGGLLAPPAGALAAWLGALLPVADGLQATTTLDATATCRKRRRERTWRTISSM